MNKEEKGKVEEVEEEEQDLNGDFFPKSQSIFLVSRYWSYNR